MIKGSVEMEGRSIKGSHPEGTPEGSCLYVVGCWNPQPLSVFPLNLGERTLIKV